MSGAAGFGDLPAGLDAERADAVSPDGQKVPPSGFEPALRGAADAGRRIALGSRLLTSPGRHGGAARRGGTAGGR
jgi:hypothetical protein